MTKEVLISVSGLQTMTEEDEQLEILVPGQYFFRGGSHYLLYEEAIEGTAAVTKNRIKLREDYMEVTRKGPVSTHMLFEKGKKNITYYYTPFGSIELGIDAGLVHITEERDNVLRARVLYALSMNHEKVADCEITLRVQPREQSIRLH